MSSRATKVVRIKGNGLTLRGEFEITRSRSYCELAVAHGPMGAVDRGSIQISTAREECRSGG